LDNENACELLVLASLHSAKILKVAAIKYIKLHANEVKKLINQQKIEHLHIFRLHRQWVGYKIQLLKGKNEELVHQIVRAIIAKD
jgi:hypothetical protein